MIIMYLKKKQLRQTNLIKGETLKVGLECYYDFVMIPLKQDISH